MSDRVDISETAACTCTRLRRTSRRVTQLYDRLLAGADLTLTQFTILVFLYHKDRRSIGGLAARLGTDPTTLNRNLKPLLKRKLVQSKTDPEDRRTHLILLTDIGRAKVGEGMPFWRRAQEQLAAAWGSDETKRLNELLDVFYGRLDESNASP